MLSLSAVVTQRHSLQYNGIAFASARISYIIYSLSLLWNLSALSHTEPHACFDIYYQGYIKLSVSLSTTSYLTDNNLHVNCKHLWSAASRSPQTVALLSVLNIRGHALLGFKLLIMIYFIYLPVKLNNFHLSYLIDPYT